MMLHTTRKSWPAMPRAGVLPVVLAVVLPLLTAASAQSLHSFQMTASTERLQKAEFERSQGSISSAACKSISAAGALRGLQAELTVTFKATDGSFVLSRFLPPMLPASAGRVVWSNGLATCQLRFPAAGAQGPLRSNGSHVLLANGRPWTGVGVNVVDDYKGGWCQGEWPISKKEVLRRLAIATDCIGVQWVRYAVQDGLLDWQGAVHTTAKEDVTLTQNAKRLDILDAAVEFAGKKGIFFEISLLFSWTITDRNNVGTPGQPLGWPTADTRAFWKVIAKRYANVPHVFFGILNEAQENHDGQHDAAYTPAVQAVVDAIRSTGANNLIAVGGSRSWSRYADSFIRYPIRDSNWAAAVHLYMRPSELETGTRYCRTRACIVEEFGPLDANDFPGYTLAETRAQVAWMKQRSLPFAGWINDEDGGPQMLQTDAGNEEYCYDNRPLRLTEWGQIMKAATGKISSCNLLAG